jgi:hypothetical protein
LDGIEDKSNEFGSLDSVDEFGIIRSLFFTSQRRWGSLIDEEESLEKRGKRWLTTIFLGWTSDISKRGFSRALRNEKLNYSERSAMKNEDFFFGFWKTDERDFCLFFLYFERRWEKKCKVKTKKFSFYLPDELSLEVWL